MLDWGQGKGGGARSLEEHASWIKVYYDGILFLLYIIYIYLVFPSNWYVSFIIIADLIVFEPIILDITTSFEYLNEKMGRKVFFISCV